VIHATVSQTWMTLAFQHALILFFHQCTSCPCRSAEVTGQPPLVLACLHGRRTRRMRGDSDERWPV